MKREAVVFEAPFRVGLVREETPEPPAGHVVVEAELSAVSAGTELLFFRGEAPAGLPLDATLSALAGTIAYPMRYGYAVVGRVVGGGPVPEGLDPEGRVFCFHPHASRLVVPAADAVAVPPDIASRDAVFLAAMETAVTLLLDGAPRIGERVAVFGAGVVGLLTTALLAAHPVRLLTVIEPDPFRRRAAHEAGAQAVLDPAAPLSPDGSCEEPETAGFDLVYELSGNPRALDRAIEAAGFGARVVVGSWYGARPCPLMLGAAFHRRRIRLISSQVSTLPPELGPRWDRRRRFAVAWEMIRKTAPSRWITHEFAAAHAADAYRLLDAAGGDALQVVLRYDPSGGSGRPRLDRPAVPRGRVGGAGRKDRRRMG